MLTLALLLVLFTLLGAALDHIEKVALLFLQVLLTVGPFLLTGVPALSTLTAALSLTLSAAKPSASTGDWGRCRGCASRGDLGHLHERACFERHHVQIAGAGKVDVFLVASEVRVSFGVGGGSDLAPLVCHVVVDEHVSAVDEKCELLVPGSLAANRRPVLGF